MSASNKPIVCPHSPRKADLRASVRDLEEDVAALDDRKRQVVRLAKGGLRMNGVWWGSDSGKRVRLSTTLVSELERWGALERVSGRELILSPYGERLLAELG